MITYMYTAYIIIDKKVGPLEALRMSAKITQGVKWDILGFILIEIALVYASILTLGLGLFIVLPLVVIGHAVLYNFLCERAELS